MAMETAGQTHIYSHSLSEGTSLMGTLFLDIKLELSGPTVWSHPRMGIVRSIFVSSLHPRVHPTPLCGLLIDFLAWLNVLSYEYVFVNVLAWLVVRPSNRHVCGWLVVWPAVTHASPHYTLAHTSQSLLPMHPVQPHTLPTQHKNQHKHVAIKHKQRLSTFGYKHTPPCG